MDFFSVINNLKKKIKYLNDSFVSQIYIYIFPSFVQPDIFGYLKSSYKK